MAKKLDKLKAAKLAKKEAETRQQWAYDNQITAYTERDKLACALARCYPSHLMLHSAAKGRYAVCIHSPAGLITFVLDDEMRERLSDLPMQANDYDGAKRADKHARLDALGSKREATIPSE